MFLLLSVMTCRWENCLADCDLGCHGVMWTPCNDNAAKRDFGITNDCLQSESVDVSFAFSEDMLFNKQSSGWGFDTSWRSCGVTVITILQNAISVLQMISSSIKVLGYFFCSQSWHAIEQIVKWTVTLGAMMLVCRHCNNNVAKGDFSNGKTRTSAWVIS